VQLLAAASALLLAVICAAYSASGWKARLVCPQDCDGYEKFGFQLIVCCVTAASSDRGSIDDEVRNYAAAQ